MKKHVVVLGFSHTALSTLRCLQELRKNEIKLWLIGDKNAEYKPAYYSGIPDRKLSYNSDLVNYLIEISNAFDEKPVLFLTEDKQVVDVSASREKLLKYYDFILPSNEVVDALMGKVEFSMLAIEKKWDIPLTFIITDLHEFNEILNKIEFPFIVKPYLMHAVKINNRQEFDDLILKLDEINYKSLIVQQYIEGEDDNIYFCFVLFSHDGEAVSSFLARKLRQHPISYGTTSLGVSIQNQELVDKTVKILRSLSYKGFGSVEYKYDKKTGKYYIMEPTVGRYNQQIAHTMAAGVNIPLNMYHMMNGNMVCNCEQRNNVYWIYESNDFFSFIKDHKKKYGYLKNYFNKRILVLFSWRDPFPLIYEILYVLYGKIKKMFLR